MYKGDETCWRVERRERTVRGGCIFFCLERDMWSAGLCNVEVATKYTHRHGEDRRVSYLLTVSLELLELMWV